MQINEKIWAFWSQEKRPTPCLVFDLDKVNKNYNEIVSEHPHLKVYYAVKANPAPQVLKRLVSLGAFFDAASIEEVRMCVDAGADPQNISFGNTVKSSESIRLAYELGVRLFVFDSEEELIKIAKNAPGSNVFCRLDVDCTGSDWPLQEKFGCSVEEASAFMQKTVDLDVTPLGVSFHVGSQQRDPRAWDRALTDVAELFGDLESKDIVLKMINLGGGLPAAYRKEIDPIPSYISDIYHFLSERLSRFSELEIMIEPGRAIVADAGVIFSQVVLACVRQKTNKRWVYIDIGRYSGLIEACGNAIEYNILTEKDADPHSHAVLAGPTCDSEDVIYRMNYELPVTLEEGDLVVFPNAGAYTTTYATKGFNGFMPMHEYYL